MKRCKWKYCDNFLRSGQKYYCSEDCRQESKADWHERCKMNLPYFKNGGKEKYKESYKIPTHFPHKSRAVQLVIPDNTYRMARKKIKEPTEWWLEKYGNKKKYVIIDK